MTVKLNDHYDIDVDGEDYSGKVVELELNGSIKDPDTVTITLDNGTTFKIPWEQYANNSR